MHIDDVIELMRGKAEALAVCRDDALPSEIAAFTFEFDSMLASMFEAGTLSQRPDREPAAVLLFHAAEVSTDAIRKAALERYAAERATAYAKHLAAVAQQLQGSLAREH